MTLPIFICLAEPLLGPGYSSFVYLTSSGPWNWQTNIVYIDVIFSSAEREFAALAVWWYHKIWKCPGTFEICHLDLEGVRGIGDWVLGSVPFMVILKLHVLKQPWALSVEL